MTGMAGMVNATVINPDEDDADEELDADENGTEI